MEFEAPDWTSAKNLSLTTVYSIAFKFDALTDLKELQIRKLSDLPNNHLRIRFELQIGCILEPLDWI